MQKAPGDSRTGDMTVHFRPKVKRFPSKVRRFPPATKTETLGSGIKSLWLEAQDIYGPIN